MKATLEFNLYDPDDKRAHLRAVKAIDMALILWEMTHNTKNSIYNQIEFEKLGPYGAVDKIFEKLYDELNNRGIIIDELIN